MIDYILEKTEWLIYKLRKFDPKCLEKPDPAELVIVSEGVISFLDILPDFNLDVVHG
jgi:hypothetical protein